MELIGPSGFSIEYIVAAVLSFIVGLRYVNRVLEFLEGAGVNLYNTKIRKNGEATISNAAKQSTLKRIEHHLDDNSDDWACTATTLNGTLNSLILEQKKTNKILIAMAEHSPSENKANLQARLLEIVQE